MGFRGARAARRKWAKQQKREAPKKNLPAEGEDGGIIYGEIVCYEPHPEPTFTRSKRESTRSKRAPTPPKGSSNKPVEQPKLSPHFVILLPPQYKHKSYINDKEYEACLVITGDPNFYRSYFRIHGKGKPRPREIPGPLREVNGVWGGINWRPVPWCKRTFVPLSVTTIHRATLHELQFRGQPIPRARLDDKSYGRLLAKVKAAEPHVWK